MIVQQRAGIGDVDYQPQLEKLRNVLVASIAMAALVYLAVSGRYDPRNW